MIYPLLYGDIQRYGLALKTSGVKHSQHVLHRSPMMDIGTYALIKQGEIAVRNKGIARLTANGVEYEGGGAEAFDVIALATG